MVAAMASAPRDRVALSTALAVKVDGKLYDDVQTGDNGDDDLSGYVRDKVVLAGLGGNDDLHGGLKGDFLIGGSGNDDIYGGGLTDLLDGGTGRDVMTGGTGADVFKFDLRDGRDRITDFAAHEDVIRMADAANRSDLTFTRMGHGVMVDFGSIHVLVEGITVAQLDRAWNFEF